MTRKEKGVATDIARKMQKHWKNEAYESFCNRLEELSTLTVKNGQHLLPTGKQTQDLWVLMNEWAGTSI